MREIPHYLTRLSTKQNNIYCLGEIASSRELVKDFSFSRLMGLGMQKDMLHKFDLYGLFSKQSQTSKKKILIAFSTTALLFPKKRPPDNFITVLPTGMQKEQLS